VSKGRGLKFLCFNEGRLAYNILLLMGKIIENYELKEQLGEGVYAKVYKAVHLVTKQ
jgi:serine/threonine protein kinase